MDRFHFDAVVSDRDLVETYFPAFEACIRMGHARSLMCSYNSVNGVPACANKFLLEEVLRYAQFDRQPLSEVCGCCIGL